jgi:hypothetical protein
LLNAARRRKTIFKSDGLLAEIIFALKTGIGCADLPQKLSCGMTCWRQRAWLAASVWDRRQIVLIETLDHAGKIDGARVALDSSSVHAVFWGTHAGPSSVNRAKPGARQDVLPDAGGIPLNTAIMPANHHGTSQLFSLLISLPEQVRAKIKDLHTDRAYDCAASRTGLRAKGTVRHLSKRGVEHGSGMGRKCWLVERTLSCAAPVPLAACPPRVSRLHAPRLPLHRRPAHRRSSSADFLLEALSDANSLSPTVVHRS